MKKSSEKESNNIPQTQERQEELELGLEQVPESVTQRLYARLAAYEAAMAEVDTKEMTQAIIENPALESLLDRYPGMTRDEQQIFLAGLEATKHTGVEAECVDNVTVDKVTVDGMTVDSETADKASIEEMEEQEDVQTRFVRRRPVKWYFLIAAVLILVLAMGTVGFGESFKWLTSGTVDVAEDKTIAVESDEDIVVLEDYEEAEAYRYAEELLGVTVVKLPKIIESVDFESVQLHGDNLGINMLYSYQDIILQYAMIQNYNAMSYNEIQIGTLIETYEVEVDGYVISVEEYLESNELITYKASFACNNIFYSLTGTVEEAVFKEILENFIFF